MRRPYILAALIVGLLAPAARSQDMTWEFRPTAGIAIPTGAHASVFDTAPLIGAQAAVRLKPEWDVVASFAWQPSNAAYTAADKRVYVLVYDAGVERIFRRRPTPGSGVVAYLGGGVGGRAFDFRAKTLSSTTCYSGYAGAGTGYEFGRSSIRVDVRDHLFCYNEPLGSRAESTRNEVSLSVSLGFPF